MARVGSSGTLAGGLPFNRIGEGPPVVVLQGRTFENRAQKGFEARFTLGLYRRLGEHRSVWVVNRRPGLARGVTLRILLGLDLCLGLRIERGVAE